MQSVTRYCGWRWCRGGMLHQFIHTTGSRSRMGRIHEMFAIDADEGEG